MCRLLHDRGDLLRQDLRGRVLAVDFPVCLRGLARFGYEHTEVGAHARVDDADVWTDDGNLLNHGVVNEDGGCLLLSRDDNAIGGCALSFSEAEWVSPWRHAPLIPRLVVP